MIHGLFNRDYILLNGIACGGKPLLTSYGKQISHAHPAH